jgi:hypothetical protein
METEYEIARTMPSDEPTQSYRQATLSGGEQQ